MSIISIIVALLVFSFIVFIHELGHYYFARKGDIAVEEFAIGMGPKLYGFTRKGTMWSIRLLPIGGYCKMVGEDGEEDSKEDNESLESIEESSDETQKNSENNESEFKVAETIKSETLSDLEGGAFYEKSVWIRIRAVFGGPLFNFILALVFSFILIGLSVISTTEIAVIGEDTPAQAAGIMVGDELISIDGHRLLRPREASIYINVPEGAPVEVVVRRDSEDITYTITPMIVETNPDVPPEESDNYYMIGIGYGQAEKSVWTVFKYGVLETLSWIKVVFYSLGLLVTGQVAATNLSGPVGLVSTIGSDYERSLAEGLKVVIANLSFWIVLISSNLGVMNLLPIPALDGGRLVFLFGEAITGKPIAPEKEGFIHFVGFAFLMLLMVFIMYNDILRLLGLG